MNPSPAVIWSGVAVPKNIKGVKPVDGIKLLIFSNYVF